MKYYSESGMKIFYGSQGAAGIDLPFYDPECESVTIQPGERVALHTGVHVKIPHGMFGNADSRSSTSKRLLSLLCHTIDEDYVGEIRLVFVNTGTEPQIVIRGEYLAQLIVQPYNRVELEKVYSIEELGSTDRGQQGFGSTGNTTIKGVE